MFKAMEDNLMNVVACDETSIWFEIDENTKDLPETFDSEGKTYRKSESEGNKIKYEVVDVLTHIYMF